LGGHRRRARRKISRPRSADDSVHRSARPRPRTRRLQGRSESLEGAEARGDPDGLVRGVQGRAMTAGGIFRPGMRAYFIPFTAGIVLTVSAFLPWVIVGGVSMNGVPDLWALWVAGLGAIAAVLAMLSLITRRNSRHPLLIVGLFALGIMFLSWRIMPRSAGERALTISQAFAIVDTTPMPAAPDAAVGIGIYLGLIASCVLVAFGLTIVVKRVSTAYVVTSPDDDVD